MSRADITMEEYARVRNARLRFGKLPVFYFPYVLWPATTERTSGWLVPKPGEEAPLLHALAERLRWASCIVTYNGKQVCYVDKLGGPEPVPVEVGLYNNHFIEITSGLDAGDRVLIAPPVAAERFLDDHGIRKGDATLRNF